MIRITEVDDIIYKIKFGYEKLYLSNKEIEDLADYMFEKSARSIVNPRFDAEEYIEFVLKTRIRYLKLSLDNSILGMTILSEGIISFYDENDNLVEEMLPIGTIVVDEQACGQNEGRFLFTLAHEIGHYLFDLPRYKKNPSLFRNNNCCRIDEENNIRDIDDIAWEERRANHFASCILMPRSIICKDLDEYLYSYFKIEQCLPAYKNGSNLNYLEAGERENVLSHFMKKYGVSRAALMNRLLTLGYLDKALFNDKKTRYDRKFNNI